jgi:hypothetical protein
MTVSAHGAALAQESPAEADKTGTNPTVLSRTFNVLNEYLSRPAGSYLNTTTVRYTEPFADGRMSLRLSVPFAAMHVGGVTDSGLGDIAAKWTWVAHLDRREGYVVSAELFAPTAGQRSLGTGKWVFAPGLTYVYFASKEIIIAPALVHNVSFAGDGGRQNVNSTNFDLYTLYKPVGQNWWLTSDLTIGHNWIANTNPTSWKLALGTTIGKLGDGVVNLTVKPGVGIGADRPFNWSLEVGLAVVGF